MRVCRIGVNSVAVGNGVRSRLIASLVIVVGGERKTTGRCMTSVRVVEVVVSQVGGNPVRHSADVYGVGVGCVGVAAGSQERIGWYASGGVRT